MACLLPMFPGITASIASESMASAIVLYEAGNDGCTRDELLDLHNMRANTIHKYKARLNEMLEVLGVEIETDGRGTWRLVALAGDAGADPAPKAGE